MRFNLSQTYFKGPGLAMFRLLLRTDYCIFLKEYLHLSSPTNAFTLSLGTVSWAPNVQAFSSSFILRFSTQEQLSSKSVILLLSVVLSLSTILASTLFALSSGWSPRDCFRTSQGRVGEWETKKRYVLNEPRWRPVHVLRFGTIFLKSRDRSQSKR